VSRHYCPHAVWAKRNQQKYACPFEHSFLTLIGKELFTIDCDMTLGIEHVIDALPAILERFPDAVYIVLGATHRM